MNTSKTVRSGINQTSLNETLTTVSELFQIAPGSGERTEAAGLHSASETKAAADTRNSQIIIFDVIPGTEGDDILYGTDGNDSIDGLGGNDQLFGLAGNDILTSGDGDDTLYGGDGIDTLLGGDGNDYLDVGTGKSTVDGGDGIDGVTYDYATATVALTATYTNGISGTISDGSTLANIEGVSFTSGSGNDTLNFAGTTADANLIDGGAGDDLITGGSGNYGRLRGGTGNDTIYSGAGSDTYIYYPGDSYGLFGGEGNDKLYGLGGNDALFGEIGNDTLDGGIGDDYLDGGDGSDTASYNSKATSGVTVSLALQGATQDTIGAGFDTLVNIENLIGSGFNDTLTGNDGNNVLNGGGGADTLTGNKGNDTYVVNSTGDLVTEATGSGTDTVQSSISYILGSYLERLTLTGSAAINGTGNSLNNILTGNVAINVLDGGQGADTLIGGDGTDTYVVDNSGDIVSESNAVVTSGGTDLIQAYISYNLNDTDGAGSNGGNVENLRLMGSGNLNGIGNGLNNVLYANTGNNSLDGGAGFDTINYAYGASTGVTVSLAISGAQATGGSGSDTLLNIENLTGSNFNDSLTGNTGNNVLNGGAGNDSLAGGLGNDTYVVNTTADVVIELFGAGIDLVQSNVSYNLTDTDGAGANGGNVENLRLMGTAAINGTGNALNNILYANTGSNSLDGGAGNDTVSYAFGASTGVTVSLAATAAQVTGGSGSDTLVNFENLTGSGFTDALTGSASNNILNGGLGNDTLFGGAGADTFVFDSALNALTNKDTISDFNVIEDSLRLENAIFTKLTVGALAAGNFVSSANAVALDSNDYLLYNTNTGTLSYDADGNGASAKVDFVTLTGIPALTAGDFMIV